MNATCGPFTDLELKKTVKSMRLSGKISKGIGY